MAPRVTIETLVRHFGLHSLPANRAASWAGALEPQWRLLTPITGQSLYFLETGTSSVVFPDPCFDWVYMPSLIVIQEYARFIQ